MKVHAVDLSGSMYQYLTRVHSYLKRNANPNDLVLTYSDRIEKVTRVSNIPEKPWEALGPGDLNKVFAWMEARHLQPTDTLILYSDISLLGDIKSQTAVDLSDIFWTLEAKVIADSLPEPAPRAAALASVRTPEQRLELMVDEIGLTCKIDILKE